MGAGFCRFKMDHGDSVYIRRTSKNRHRLLDDDIPPPPPPPPTSLPSSEEFDKELVERKRIFSPSKENVSEENVQHNTQGQNIPVSDNDLFAYIASTISGSDSRKIEVIDHIRYISNIESALILVRAAVEEDKNRNFEVSLTLYDYAIVNFKRVIQYEKCSGRVKEAVEYKLKSYIERAEKIRTLLENKKCVSTDADSEQLVNQIKSSILVDHPKVMWCDVSGLEDAKIILREAFIFPVKFPHMVSCGKKPWKGILLYGLQGTGKSLLAKATAAEATSHTIFYLTPSHLTSKWLGECEKLAKYLFDMAKEKSPSMIFIDEIHSLRITDLDTRSDSIRRMKTEFLLQLENLDLDSENVTVLGATCRPWDLDDSLLRWFEKKIYIPLPDENARLSIIKMNVKCARSNLDENDLKLLAQKTDGYSGDDIAILMTDAMMQPFRKIQKATHFMKVTGSPHNDPNITVDDLLTPCSPTETGAIEMSWTDIPEDKLMEPSLTMDDVLNSLATTRPSSKKEDLLQLVKFMHGLGLENENECPDVPSLENENECTDAHSLENECTDVQNLQ